MRKRNSLDDDRKTERGAQRKNAKQFSAQSRIVSVLRQANNQGSSSKQERERGNVYLSLADWLLNYSSRT